MLTDGVEQCAGREVGRLKLKRIGGAVAFLAWALSGCASKPLYTVSVAEEKAVVHCAYIDTISENSDMGAFQIHPKLTYDATDHVLRRAEMMNATHVVWLVDYPFGAAAMAYHCGN
jgi:hypothetical protein